jgi:hypothetical protein
VRHSEADVGHVATCFNFQFDVIEFSDVFACIGVRRGVSKGVEDEWAAGEWATPETALRCGPTVGHRKVRHGCHRQNSGGLGEQLPPWWISQYAHGCYSVMVLASLSVKVGHILVSLIDLSPRLNDSCRVYLMLPRFGFGA